MPRRQAFAGRLLTALNDAALCLMVSVGHRTGLFDVMTQSPPTTSEDLASKAGLNERYMREWLGAMVTARVVTITTFDAIHDQAKPLNVLKGIHRALKPDGVYLMQDIGGTSHMDRDIEHPIGTFLYAISCMHCMTVSLAQGGEGLGAMWGEETTREYLQRAGFQSIATHRLAHDIQNNWYVVRK